jgi:pantoate--beta-alanine ligase
MNLVATQIDEVRQAVARARQAGHKIGFVPTMGALHDGHASLFRIARQETEFVIVSIFVNPLQFAAGEDFGRYPRPLERDLEVCRQEKVDLVFVPTVETIYPSDFRTHVEVDQLGETLCGPHRPGHFSGVATIVLKLFNIVQPDQAYFGQKDGQQTSIIRRMVRDLCVPVGVRVCPTVREPDGLAMSSRNQYLTAEQRAHAPALFQALQEAKHLIEAGECDPEVIRKGLMRHLRLIPGALVEYADVVAAETLRPPGHLQGEVMLAVAVKFGATRLIDNLLVII